MDFFSVTEVVNRRYSKLLKILLGVICLLDIFVVAVELVTSGGIGAIFIVPLIILIPAFLKMGTKNYTADILCNISDHTESVVLFMSNVVIDKNAVLSRSYALEKRTLSVFVNQELGKVFLVGNGRVELLDQKRKAVFGQDFFEETIELTVKKTTFEELTDFLGDYIKQQN